MTEYFTLAEVAAERKVSRDVVYRARKRAGVGEYFGGQAGYRFTREDIDKMFAPMQPKPVIRRRRRRSA